MTDAFISYTSLNGRRSIEEASQFLGRQLLPVGDGLQTIPDALADRPTQADVARALQGIGSPVQLGGIVGPDMDYLIPAGSVHVVIPLLTDDRTWSLFDVDGYPYGQDLVIVDEGRFLGSGPTLTVIPLAGSGDAIAGFSNGIVLADAGTSVRLRRGLLSDVWVLV